MSRGGEGRDGPAVKLRSKQPEQKARVEKRGAENPPVTYLDTDEQVERFLQTISGARQIAVDTEGASFHRFVDRVYLMQLSTRDHHAIVDPLPIKPPDALGAMLADPGVESVFHDADYDLRLLRRDFGWRVAKLFDTRVAAQLLGIRQFGLAALLDSHFGVKLDKKHQRADWSMRPLPEDMLEYAAQDTMHLLPLRQRLYDALDRKGRLHWAQEEFERLEGTKWEDGDEDLSFLRIKGARDISRRELAILRELVAWRDGVAKELDRSTFRVAGNEVLLSMAQTSPTSVAAVESTKGLSRSVVTRHSRAIIDAVARGKAVPESDLPKFPRGPRWARDPDFDTRVSALKAVRDRRATELELDPGVLCPRERLEGIARRNPRTIEELMEVPDVRRWQAEVLGKEFIQALRSSAPDESPYKAS